MTEFELTATVNGEPRRWPLAGERLGIGRSSRNTIHIADATVSKDHAELCLRDGRWHVLDLGSRNGTRVNGIDVTEAAPVRPGDSLEVGQVMMRIAPVGGPALTQFSASAGLGSSVKIQAQQLLESGGGTRVDPARLVRVLAEAGRQLVLPRPLRETCEELLGFVEQAMPASRLVLLLREDPASDPVQIAARYKGVTAREPLALSRTIMDAVLNDCTSVITRDASADPRFQAQMSIVSQGVHSAMAVPLFDNERVLGLLYADTNVLTVHYDEEHLEVFTLLGNMAAVKITNARLLEAAQARARLEQEVATATRIQRTLLFPPPVVPGWGIHARLQTCFEVGGDLYDFHMRDDGRLVFVVGDVSGKGMGAALLMSSVLSSSRVLYDACDDPAQLAMRLNAVMHRSTDPGHFVTMFVGYLDLSDGSVRYVNAGHNSPMIVGESATRELAATGTPIAILPDFPYTTGETVLARGELLAVFTDGIPEAQRGEAFYEDARLESRLRALNGAVDIADIGRGVLEDVDAFVDGGERTDDITLVLLRREG